MTVMAFIAKDSMKANPNFNTNAPPFEVRGCKVILGGAFLDWGGAKSLTINNQLCGAVLINIDILISTKLVFFIERHSVNL